MIVRTEIGLECDECSWAQDLDAAEQEREVKVYAGFKPKTFKIRIDDPEEGENFLRGLIVARSNNSSEYFVDLIDAVNAILQPWRLAQLQEEIDMRSRAGMG
jgi:nitrate reductase alpha subunit